MEILPNVETPESGRLPITALVVCFDEYEFLGRCLDSIDFCEEIILVNIGPIGATDQFKRKINVRVVELPRETIVEKLRLMLIHRASNDWVLLVDPDERFSPQLGAWLKSNFAGRSGDLMVAGIKFPWIFHAFDKPLRGTPWGGQKRKLFLVNRTRVTLTDFVHAEPYTKTGHHFWSPLLPLEARVDHFWLTDFGRLLEKSERYIREEARSRLARGIKAHPAKIIARAPLHALYSYVFKRGFLDGGIGFLLSLFWSWYQTRSDWQLHRATREKAGMFGGAP